MPGVRPPFGDKNTMNIFSLFGSSQRLPGRILAWLLLSACFLPLWGCSKEAWIPEKKEAVYRAEITNLPDGQGLHFKKLNDFAWNNVVFSLNKDYIFFIEQVPEGQREFMIEFEGFRHKDTGEPFDPAEQEVWRIWIEGDEGYWY